jgi:hypothetical protein
MSLHNKVLDPRIIEHYRFVFSLNGTVVSNDMATGDMSAFAGTNFYMGGTWSLKKVENK